jgi:hypothetical protein
MRKSNFALRLQPSLLEELRGVAEADDTTLNQFINLAVAEKLAALRTERYFRERAARADIPGALAVLDRLGVGRAPRDDDQISRRTTKSGARAIDRKSDEGRLQTGRPKRRSARRSR